MCIPSEDYPCPKCNGEDENCTLCGGSGFINLDTFNPSGEEGWADRLEQDLKKRDN